MGIGTEMLTIFITVGAVFFIIARYFLFSGVHFQILRAIYRVRSNVTYGTVAGNNNTPFIGRSVLKFHERSRT